MALSKQLLCDYASEQVAVLWRYCLDHKEGTCSEFTLHSRKPVSSPSEFVKVVKEQACYVLEKVTNGPFKLRLVLTVPYGRKNLAYQWAFPDRFVIADLPKKIRSNQDLHAILEDRLAGLLLEAEFRDKGAEGSWIHDWRYYGLELHVCKICEKCGDH